MLNTRRKVYTLIGAGGLGCALYFLTPSIESSQRRDQSAPFKSYTTIEFSKSTKPHAEIYRFGEHTIEVVHFSNASDTLIICLPILSGESILPNYFARQMVRSGYDAVIIHRDQNLFSKIEPHNINQTLKWIVDSHCSLIANFAKEYDRIGIVGVSLGGIIGTLLMGHCDEVDSLVSIGSGQNIAKILIETNEVGLRRKREKILTSHTEAELSRELQQSITYDPRFVAKSIDPQSVLLVLARFDRIVPYHHGLALKESLGNPKTITLPTTHLGGLLYLPYIKNKAIQHFRKSL